MPAEPGWYLPISLYYYDGNASAAKTFQIGLNAVSSVRGRSVMTFAAPTFVPNTTVLGGRPALSLAWAYGGVKVDGVLVLSPTNATLRKSDTDWGSGDLYPLASLSWSHGSGNWMAYVTGDIPVGAYDDKRLENIGLGHGAADVGGAYTYVDAEDGHELTAVAGVTYNLTNSSTDYRSGVDSHLDWGTTQFLSAHWHVGLAGYVYYQLTGDSGAGDKVGGFESRVAAVGPQLGYLFKVGSNDAYLNLRGYREFSARNRTERHAVFALINVPLDQKQ